MVEGAKGFSLYWANMSCSVSTVLVQTPRGKKRNTQKMSPKNWILIPLDWIFRLRFMVFNATFNNIFSYIVAVRFIGGGHRSTRRKTTDRSQVTEKLYHIILCRVHLGWAGFELKTFVVIGTDCIGGCKSSYHTVTTAPAFNGL